MNAKLQTLYVIQAVNNDMAYVKADLKVIRVFTMEST